MWRDHPNDSEGWACALGWCLGLGSSFPFQARHQAGAPAKKWGRVSDRTGPSAQRARSTYKPVMWSTGTNHFFYSFIILSKFLFSASNNFILLFCFSTSNSIISFCNSISRILFFWVFCLCPSIIAMIGILKAKKGIKIPKCSIKNLLQY